jgi:hypothetical protein
MTFVDGKYVPRSDVPCATPEGVMLVKDVAALLGLRPKTVLSYLKESRETVGDKRGRYADHPFPPPRGRLHPTTVLWWKVEDAEAIREWDRLRPTQSHGRGRQAPGLRGPNPRKRKETGP